MANDANDRRGGKENVALEATLDAGPSIPAARALGSVHALGTQPTMVSSMDHRHAGVLVRGPSVSAPDYSDPTIVSHEHYTQRVELSRGGMGRIERARDRRLHREVAIKELRADTPELRARFERETLLTARLQHPGIVSIYEAGRWPSGEPFYAMKLVRGRSLEDAIGERRTQAERLALLPHLIAVAEALGYAHAERVIHRDLKPHNVMIGEFGETVVIDWGLAKDLDDASDAEVDRTNDRYIEASGETEYGAVLGTPAYMPPEQARGEPVDERADVYAIGVMLYQVLAGKPLFSGTSSQEILEAVKRGPERSVDEDLPGVAPDLVAIVRRAIEPEPGARYRDARALADDLRRFQTGQLVGAHQYSVTQRIARWLRRHRTAAVVAAIAFAVVAVISVASVRRILEERRHAEDQRARAEQHRADVEDLLGFLVGDLHDKLAPIGKVDLLDAVARKAQAYYAKHAPEQSEDKQKRSTLLRHVGDVLAARGDSAGAMASYRTALADAEEVMQAAPQAPSARYELAEVHRKIALAQRDRGDLAGAITSLEAARATLDPRSSELRERALLATIEFTTGDALDFSRKGKEARPRLQAAREIASDLVARAPGDSEMIRLLVSTNLKLGDSMLVQSDATGALTAYRAARDASSRLVTLDPENAIWKQLQATADEKVGDVAWDQGDGASALASYRTLLAAREQLATRDPSNRELQHHLFIAKTKIGNALHTQKDFVAALAAKREALEIAQRLAAADPKNTTWLRDASVVQGSVGDTLLASGSAAAALESYRAANATMARLVGLDPANLQWQRDRMIGHLTVGGALAGSKDQRGAAREYGEAVRLAEEFAAKNPTDGAKRDLLITRLMLTGTLDAAGDLGGALESAQVAVALAREIGVANPTNVDAQRTLTSALLTAGTLHLRRRSFDAAVAASREAVTVAERLAATDPASADWQHDVATAYQELGDALRPRDRSAAKAAYSAALGIVERFVTSSDKTNPWEKDRAELRKLLERR